MYFNLPDFQLAMAIVATDRALASMSPPESIYDGGEADELLDRRLDLTRARELHFRSTEPDGTRED